MADRITQEVVEVVYIPNPVARLTQETVEVVISGYAPPAGGGARTQVVIVG